MARSEARISVNIWTDDDFLALAPTAQRMFMFLLSQPDLAHDGVIALRERRWSKKAAGLTRDDVERDLAILSDARFVVIDEDAEELLIRSFIRRDKVYRQPNVLRSAQDHLEVVSSPIIRAAIAVELRRIADSGELKEDTARIVAEMLDAIGNPSPNPSGNPSPEGSRNLATDGSTDAREGQQNPSATALTPQIQPHSQQNAEQPARPPESAVSAGENPSGNPSPNPSGNPSAAAPGERGVVTAVSRDSPFPDSSGPGPLPSAARPGDGDVIDAEIVDTPRALALVTDEPENAGHITKQWIDHCTANGVKLTKNHIGRYAGAIKSALDQGFPPSLIKTALGQMLTDRVTSRVAFFDNYLVRAQQGPELPPRRASRTEASIARSGDSATAARIRDALTRPA